MRRSAIVLVLLGTVVVVGHAQPRPSSRAPTPPDPLVAIADADPIELARVAARLGDDAVLARLDRRRPAAVRLAAVRATPFLRAPERALAALAEIAAGRDPHLAPAAAQALLAIAGLLDAPALERRETMPAELAGARHALAALAADETARADVRRAAARTAQALAAAGVSETGAVPDRGRKRR